MAHGEEVPALKRLNSVQNNRNDDLSPVQKQIPASEQYELGPADAHDIELMMAAGDDAPKLKQVEKPISTVTQVRLSSTQVDQMRKMLAR